MITATTTSTLRQAPLAGDPTTSAGIGAIAGIPGDATSSGTDSFVAFGRLLAERMDTGTTSDGFVPDAATAPSVAVRTNDVGSGALPAASRDIVPTDVPTAGVGIAVPLDLYPTCGVPVAAGTDAVAPAVGSDAPRTTADGDSSATIVSDVFAAARPIVVATTMKTDDPVDTTSASKAGDAVDDAMANDLAAQMALASQWTALAPTAAPAVPMAGRVGNGIRTDQKLDALRATIAKGAADASAFGMSTTASTPIASASGSTATIDPAAASRTTVPDAAVHAPIGWTAALARAAGMDGGRPDRTTSDASTAIADAIVARLDGAAHAPGDAPMSGASSVAIAPVTPAPGTAAPAPAVMHLREPVGTPAWAHDVGQATLRMAVNDLQSASLRLHPENLGPVDVQLRIDNGVAHLSFAAAHQDTRQALESSRTTLDQMFADQGLKIGDCAVNDSSSSSSSSPWDRFEGNPSQAGGPRADGGGRRGRGTDAGDGDASTTVVTRRTQALGLVDTFA